MTSLTLCTMAAPAANRPKSRRVSFVKRVASEERGDLVIQSFPVLGSHMG